MRVEVIGGNCGRFAVGSRGKLFVLHDWYESNWAPFHVALTGVLGHSSAESPPFAIEGESGFAKIAVIGIVHEQGPLNESTIPASSLLWMHARHQAPGAWPSR